MDIFRVSSERKAPEDRRLSAKPINPCTDNLRRSWCTGSIPFKGSTGRDKQDFLFRSPSSSLVAPGLSLICSVSDFSSVGVVLSLCGGVSTSLAGLRGSISACSVDVSGSLSGSVSVIDIGATSGITGVLLNDSLNVSFGVSADSSFCGMSNGN